MYLTSSISQVFSFAKLHDYSSKSFSSKSSAFDIRGIRTCINIPLCFGDEEITLQHAQQHSCHL